MVTKTLTLIAALAMAVPAAAAPESLRLMESAANDVGSALGTKLTLEEAPKVRFADVEGDRLQIAPSTMVSATTLQEARALLALIIAYRAKSFDKLNLQTSGLANVVSGVGHMIAEGNATTTTSADGRQYPKYTAQEQRAHAIKQGQKRAAFAVQLASRAGSCTGPMVDMLKRMRQTSGGSSATAEAGSQSAFARQVLRDLASSAYPPDRRCQVS